jgi:hypothetical protein
VKFKLEKNYMTEIDLKDLKAASDRLLSQALQAEFDRIIATEGVGAENAIGRALANVSNAGRPSAQQETTTI